jgi:hypothetical protein
VSIANKRGGFIMDDCTESAFREAVCIDAGRIYDSCCDKDCLTDLKVLFPEAIQRSVVDNASGVKIKSVSVLNVLTDVEPVPFNKGFFSVNMKFFFEVNAEITTTQGAVCTAIGVATAEKKAVLFGSDGNVKVFESTRNGEILNNKGMPTVRVQVAEPICLDSKIVPYCSPCMPIKLPDCVLNYFKTQSFGRCEGSDGANQKELLVTLGVFSIVMLKRRVQMLVPCYDFCIPDKDCSQTQGAESSPCEFFAGLKFPTDEFFPPKLDLDGISGCGCN